MTEILEEGTQLAQQWEEKRAAIKFWSLLVGLAMWLLLMGAIFEWPLP